MIRSEFQLYGQAIPLDKLQYNTLKFTDGLSSNSLLSTFKDKNGYLWYGSHNLQRFDGHKMKYYYTKESGMIFGKMLDDGNGDLFIHTYFHGILKYDAKRDTFLRFQDSISVNGKMLAMRGDFATASNGDIWYAGGWFIAVLKKGSDRFVDITPKLGLPYETNYYMISIDANDQWWLSTPTQGMLRINTRTWKITNHLNNTKDEPIFDQFKDLARIMCDKQNNLWIQKFYPPHPSRDLIRYDLKNNTLHTYVFPYKSPFSLEFPNTWVHNYFLDSKDILWVRLGENVGIARYLNAEDRFEILYTEKSTAHGIEGRYNIGSPSPPLTADRQGQFWTSSNYITYFDPYRQSIFNVSNEDLIRGLYGQRSSKFEILNSAQIRNIIQAKDGFFYISHEGLGIVRLDKNLKNPSQLFFHKNKATYTTLLFTIDSMTFYFADENSDIYSITAGQSKIKKIIDGASYNYKYIRSAFAESDTSIWLGHAGNGISRFNPVTKKIYNYNPIFLPYSYKEKTNIYNISPYDKDNLWLCCYRRGLQLFNKKTGIIVRSWSHVKISNKNNAISYFDHLRLGNDTLVLASDDGLILYDMKRSTYTRMHTGNGLPDNLCFNILQLKNSKKIAVSTSEGGFFYIDLVTKKVTRPSADQGNDYFFFRQGGIVSKTGQLIFIGQINGLVVVNPTCDPPFPMKLHLTNVILNGNNIPIDSLRKINHLLSAREEQNQIEINFSTMDIWRKNSAIYSIWLKGADKKWKRISTPTVFLQSLKSGYYELWVNVDDQSDGAHDMSRLLAIWIEPIWYKSWWFAMVMLLGISTALYIYFYFRQEERQKLNDAQLKVAVLHSENMQKAFDLEHVQKQLTKVQFEALRAQMNPHFLFNSLSSIENYIIKNDSIAASNYLQTFSKLIRNILDSSRQELVPFNKDLETLKWYIELEQVRFRNLFHLEMNIDNNVISQNPLIPPLLVQPFIENSILHGFGPSNSKDLILNIKAFFDGDFLVYIITDNGIGRKAAASFDNSNKRVSNGMNITKQRLILHNDAHYNPEQLAIIDLLKDDMAMGTQVKIKIFIKREQ